MTQNTKDAVPTQTLAEQAETLQLVYDLVGMGALARTPGILLTNLENMKRRSDCLSGIEQLFTYEVPDDDMPDEMTDECDLNWGQCRAEYVETFKAALPAFIARHTEYAPTAEQAEGVRVSDRLAKLLAHCSDMGMTYDRQSRVKVIRATFKINEKTSDYLQEQFALIADEFIENAAPAASAGDQEIGDA